MAGNIVYNEFGHITHWYLAVNTWLCGVIVSRLPLFTPVWCVRRCLRLPHDSLDAWAVAVPHQGPYSWVGHNTLWPVITPMIEHTATTSYSWARKTLYYLTMTVITLGPNTPRYNEGPSYAASQSRLMLTKYQLLLFISIIYRLKRHLLQHLLQCNLILWVVSALFKMFYSSFLFVSMLNRLLSKKTIIIGMLYDLPSNASWLIQYLSK